MKLTASQARNLDIIRKAGGTIVSKRFEYFAPGSSKPIRGLHSKTMDGLRRAGLLTAFDHEGQPLSVNSVMIPARITLVERVLTETTTGNSMHSTKGVKHDLDNWLDSHGYRHEHARKPKTPRAPVLSYTNWTTQLSAAGRRHGVSVAYGPETRFAWKSGMSPDEYARSLRGLLSRRQQEGGRLAFKPSRSTPAVPTSSKPCKCAEPWVTVEHPTPCRVCGGAVEDDEEFPKQGHARIIHQPPTGRPVFAAHERDHHITTSGRRSLEREQFALPPGPEEKRRGIAGRLPIDTIARARNALQRASQMEKRGHLTAGQLAEVRQAVHRAWPSIRG